MVKKVESFQSLVFNAHICDQILSGFISFMEFAVSFPTYNLKNQDSKTIDIRFHRELAMHQILWRNVATRKKNKFLSLPVTKKVIETSEIERQKRRKGTYWVPTTLLVSARDWSTLKILAIPKSATLGSISASKRMLLALRSRCMILRGESWWRYRIPLAVPTIILYRFAQSSWPFFVGSV